MGKNDPKIWVVLPAILTTVLMGNIALYSKWLFVAITGVVIFVMAQRIK